MQKFAGELIPLSNIKPIHPFPARMAPSIAFDELPSSSTPLRVLDPMVGSGTTAVVARAKGHHAIGFDSDPLAVALSSAWCADLKQESIEDLAGEVLKEAVCRHKKLDDAKSFPVGADEATKEFVKFWFDQRNRLQLRALADAIEKVPKRSERTILWCGFSRLIITKSRGVSLAMDLSHSRPHKVFKSAPIEPFKEFSSAVKRVLTNMPFKGKLRSLPHASIRKHDARKLPLPDKSVDFVITSPPYLNAIDYIRCSKFTLVWMGHKVSELGQLRSNSIGAQRAGLEEAGAEEINRIIDFIGTTNLVQRSKGILKRYAADLRLVLNEIARVLIPKGKAIFVVGNSNISGVFVKNSEIIRLVGEDCGLTLKRMEERDLLPSRRYLPPPNRPSCNKMLAERMQQEVIMHFTFTRD
jgi:DNA modification methylase